MTKIKFQEHDHTGPQKIEPKHDFGIVIAPTPKYVGGYDITGKGGGANSIMYMMDKKPKWHHRFFTRLFLGWVWVQN